MDTDERWYVRFHGHTLGPLSAEQIKASLQRKEIGEQDRVSSTRDPHWIPISQVPNLRPQRKSLAASLPPIPPVQILKKRTAPVPPFPAPQAKKKASDQSKKLKKRSKKKFIKPKNEKQNELKKESTEKIGATSSPLERVPIFSTDEKNRELLESLRLWQSELPLHPRKTKNHFWHSIRWAPFAALGILLVASGFFFYSRSEKMRGPEGIYLPDPSGPTIQPSTEDDPNLQLKAPTRPKRE